MKHVKSYLTILFATLLLVGCVTTPKSFDQSLAYAYSTNTAILNAAANAVTAGTLEVSDAEKVLEMADQAKLLLDTAKGVAITGDMPRAEAQLQLALNILTQLQVYVNERAVK